MNEIFALFWMIVAAVAIVVFSVLKKLPIVWICPGAIVAAVIAYCDKNIAFQLLALIVIYAVGYTVYNILDEKLGLTEVNIENVIGLSCKVCERIDNYAGSGLVIVRGQEWAARSVSDDDVYEQGDKLSVVAIEGARLICKRKK